MAIRGNTCTRGEYKTRLHGGAAQVAEVQQAVPLSEPPEGVGDGDLNDGGRGTCGGETQKTALRQPTTGQTPPTS